MRRIYFYKKTEISVVILETFVTVIILSVFLWKKFDYHWAINFVAVPVITGLFIFLFLKWRLSRYIMTLFFSVLYGLSGYYIGRFLQSDGVSVGIVFAYAAYFASLCLHEMEYRELKN
ncbi:MAG: hypothetical protein MUW56_02935 [Chryseobacterium sp.]|uniref:hypothetical protein n=1 Tax=Chryseobacterium sp. TaxID=1871047 RepID=UPI0025C1CA8E|nr:hypothetical protein [Chryseobacterium sp.]MCJ7932601.1 hypothetical protein [Chryseobacterium sp.]